MAIAFPEFHNPTVHPVSQIIDIPSFSLLGKTVFVSGGSRGIGLATARLFLAEGAMVAICGRDPAPLTAGDTVTLESIDFTTSLVAFYRTA